MNSIFPIKATMTYYADKAKEYLMNNPSTFIGAASSASIRYVNSVCFDPWFGIKGVQSGLFHVLDMAISSYAIRCFYKMRKGVVESYVLGRGLGILAAATATAAITGRYNVIVLMFTALFAQTIGTGVKLTLGGWKPPLLA